MNTTVIENFKGLNKVLWVIGLALLGFISIVYILDAFLLTEIAYLKENYWLTYVAYIGFGSIILSVLIGGTLRIIGEEIS